MESEDDRRGAAGGKPTKSEAGDKMRFGGDEVVGENLAPTPRHEKISWSITNFYTRPWLDGCHKYSLGCSGHSGFLFVRLTFIRISLSFLGAD